MKTQSYWNWKDSEIKQELEDRKIEIPEYSRKAAIDALQLNDKTDEIKEGRDYVDELKETQPEITFTKCVFHSTGEQDIPYVPIGHNGRCFVIPKEMEVEVPDFILQSCIKDAVEDRMYPVVDTRGDIEWKIKKVQRFPYTIVHN